MKVNNFKNGNKINYLDNVEKLLLFLRWASTFSGELKDFTNRQTVIINEVIV